MKRHSLIFNAYHVLGLDSSSSQRDINKRAKEIMLHIGMDEVPEYEMDLISAEDFRTEDSIPEAKQMLHNPKKRIEDFFFWFYPQSEEDTPILDMVANHHLDQAFDAWQKMSEEQSRTKSQITKKNAAVAALYFFITTSPKKMKKRVQSRLINESLALWKELIPNATFWKTFTRIYALHDEQNLNTIHMEHFQSDVVNSLADIFGEIHDLTGDTQYLSAFHKHFNVQSKKFSTKVLDPAFEAINNTVKILESMKISADGVFDEDESNAVKTSIRTFQDELNELIDLGLGELSETKIMRDRAAEAIRTISLDLYNNLSEMQKALGLLKIAIDLCGTETLQSKLKTEYTTIEKNIEKGEQNYVNIPHPISSKIDINFYNTFVEQGKIRMPYEIIESVCYHSESKSVYFLPIFQSYSFKICSSDHTICMNFGSSLHIGGKRLQEKFVRLINASKVLVEPHVVQNLVRLIFVDKETVQIGGIRLDAEGIWRRKFFGGEKLLAWSDDVFEPQLKNGEVYIIHGDHSYPSTFASISMQLQNAAIMPELVKECVDNYLRLTRTHEA